MFNINILKDWNVKGKKAAKGYLLKDSIIAEYPTPENSVGWYPIGFERGNDNTFEVMGWYGLKVCFETQKDDVEILVKAKCLTVKANRPQEESIRTKIYLGKAGKHFVNIKLSDFEIETCKDGIWRFLKSFEFEGDGELISANLTRGDRIFVETNILGKSGDVGEEVTYTMTIYNCTDEKQNVIVKQIFHGWESLFPVITPSQFILEPNEKQAITATVKIHDYMVSGGHENTRLRFIANGDSNSSVDVELKTLRRLKHPYLYYNDEQWKETKEKIEKYPKFKQGYNQIIKTADKWEVKPPVPLDERDYCYETFEEDGLMSSAYAYALTKDIKYAEKIAQFLRYFTDENIGYPKKKRGCHQSYVQEGHFIKHIAIPYDIIHDSGVLTEEDHKAVEKTFRIYIDILDKHIQEGMISNWLLSEIAGGFYCALAIEDIERALRFVFGTGGAIDQLKYGAFTDGWWHECSVSYNTWVSSIYLHIAHALLPFGYNIFHTHFRIPFNDEIHATYNSRDFEMEFGMYNKKWGGNIKSYICIKDLFDATLPFLDYRGVLFGICDSEERKIEGIHLGSTFDLAYRYYKDPEYVPILNKNEYDDPIFGNAELPKYESANVKKNAFSDNIGIAMLRSQKENREQKDQIQAVLRYGSHGYAHGHFDRTELLSIMRYGRSFFNPEHCWWGYKHFMYKFYVQNSITKNMVVVDEKMQVPSDSKRILFYSGKSIQACGLETKSKWSYPPYGGMIYRDYKDDETLEERCKFNASSLPKLKDAPAYGEMTDYTEPILQKRVMALTHDYIVLFDYLEGDKEHQYDSLLQIKGFKEIKGDNVSYVKHTSQFTENPLSDGQFVTDCNWYNVEGNSLARFETIFDDKQDFYDRGSYSTPGVLKMDVHTAWPQKTEQIIGRVAVCTGGLQIPLEYYVEVDEEVKVSGEFGAWILGEGKCEILLNENKKLKLRVKNNPIYNEQLYPQKTGQGLFWGEAYIVTSDGTRINLSELELTYKNVDKGFGIGKDYANGRVTIIGDEYSNAIPTSPIDHEEEAIITLDLEKLNAVKFVGLIGADAFLGEESQKRKTYAVRTRGKVARYVTVIEPFENNSVIECVKSKDENNVEILLKDGKTQIITVNNMERENLSVKLTEYKNNVVINEELAAEK